MAEMTMNLLEAKEDTLHCISPLATTAGQEMLHSANTTQPRFSSSPHRLARRRSPA
jgi:hypothetical protein